MPWERCVKWRGRREPGASSVFLSDCREPSPTRILFSVVSSAPLHCGHTHGERVEAVITGADPQVRAALKPEELEGDLLLDEGRGPGLYRTRVVKEKRNKSFANSFV